VQLTRDNDVFIPLRERVAIARAARADLFVSLHADSNDHREIRGASVYTLSEDASDREAAKLAEDLQLWEQLVSLYDYLEAKLPPLAPLFETKKLKAKSHLSPVTGG